MRRIGTFFKLIRWPNLVFIILAQGLFYHTFFTHSPAVFFAANPRSGSNLFLLILLITASVLIAAAGYIINDYLDIKIDLINRPATVIIGRYISKKTALDWYIIFNILGLIIFLYLSVTLKNFSLIFINTIVAFSLLVYSTSLKKKFLIGNFLVSLLTAWVILILPISRAGTSPGMTNGFSTIWTASLVFASFAFISSMIREVIKDIEDRKGDQENNCTTLPVVLGVSGAKVYTGVWILVLISATLIAAFYAAREGKWITTGYTAAFLLTPLILSLFKLYNSQIPDDFHKLSSLIKWIMLAGILSMLFL